MLWTYNITEKNRLKLFFCTLNSAVFKMCKQKLSKKISELCPVGHNMSIAVSILLHFARFLKQENNISLLKKAKIGMSRFFQSQVCLVS